MKLIIKFKILYLLLFISFLIGSNSKNFKNSTKTYKNYYIILLIAFYFFFLYLFSIYFNLISILIYYLL